MLVEAPLYGFRRRFREQLDEDEIEASMKTDKWPYTHEGNEQIRYIGCIDDEGQVPIDVAVEGEEILIGFRLASEAGWYSRAEIRYLIQLLSKAHAATIDQE